MTAQIKALFNIDCKSRSISAVAKYNQNKHKPKCKHEREMGDDRKVDPKRSNVRWRGIPGSVYAEKSQSHSIYL